MNHVLVKYTGYLVIAYAMIALFGFAGQCEFTFFLHILNLIVPFVLVYQLCKDVGTDQFELWQLIVFVILVNLISSIANFIHFGLSCGQYYFSDFESIAVSGLFVMIYSAIHGLFAVALYKLNVE